jgi:hypothetical protein
LGPAALQLRFCSCLGRRQSACGSPKGQTHLGGLPCIRDWSGYRPRQIVRKPGRLLLSLAALPDGSPRLVSRSQKIRIRFIPRLALSAPARKTRTSRPAPAGCWWPRRVPYLCSHEDAGGAIYRQSFSLLNGPQPLLHLLLAVMRLPSCVYFSVDCDRGGSLV